MTVIVSGVGLRVTGGIASDVASSLFIYSQCPRSVRIIREHGMTITNECTSVRYSPDVLMLPSETVLPNHYGRTALTGTLRATAVLALYHIRWISSRFLKVKKHSYGRQVGVWTSSRVRFRGWLYAFSLKSLS